jgi:hypothetical protein
MSIVTRCGRPPRSGPLIRNPTRELAERGLPGLPRLVAPRRATREREHEAADADLVICSCRHHAASSV